jgi:uncharacterized protein (TIGR00297 family)
MDPRDVTVLLILIAGVVVSAWLKKLTPAAAITGGLLGWAIYTGVGYAGLILLALFFITGTAATSWKKKEKLQFKGAAAHQSTRHTGQVIANAGVAAIAGLLAALNPACRSLFFLMVAGALSSATADTLSSELGMVYGRRFFNILNWKPDKRGLDGVISVEGLVIGMAGSALIALAYGLCMNWDPRFTWTPLSGWDPHFARTLRSAWDSRVLIIVLAGTIGNLVDSYLGALFERRGLLSNDAVNFLNTLIAAACAGALAGFRC